MKKPKRKPAEAWLVVGENGAIDSLDAEGRMDAWASRRQAHREKNFPDDRLVRLVEHDPRAAAVVKAARKWAKSPFRMNGSVDIELAAAVERMERKR